MKNISAYPLNWPQGWKRVTCRKRGKFNCNTLERATSELLHELHLMGVGDWNVIISTNVPLRRDGLPYSGMANPVDSGAAVYFKYKEKNMVFACDTYVNVIDNVWAIRHTIEALRGIQRWGASDMMERSFTGFEALPPARGKNWWEILEVPRQADLAFIKDAYKKKAIEFHPDKTGGSHDMMAEVNRAWSEAEKERGR